MPRRKASVAPEKAAPVPSAPPAPAVDPARRVEVEATEMGYYGDQIRTAGARFFAPANAVPSWAKVV